MGVGNLFCPSYTDLLNLRTFWSTSEASEIVAFQLMHRDFRHLRNQNVSSRYAGADATAFTTSKYHAPGLGGLRDPSTDEPFSIRAL